MAKQSLTIKPESVVHFEVPATNPKKLQKFYTTVFGWMMNDIPKMKYTIVQSAESTKDGTPKIYGAINGGMYKRSKKTEQPTIVIGVASIDETIKKVLKAKGKVAQAKMPIPGMGSFARIKDSDGNLIGLFEYDQK